jgi:hypothetical protein
LQEAQECAQGDSKTMEMIQAVINEIPKGRSNAKSIPFGRLYSDKPQFADPIKNSAEEERLELASMSNIKWLIYPYKKMLCKLFGYFFCRKDKPKTT